MTAADPSSHSALVANEAVAHVLAAAQPAPDVYEDTPVLEFLRNLTLPDGVDPSEAWRIRKRAKNYNSLWRNTVPHHARWISQDRAAPC